MVSDEFEDLAKFLSFLKKNYPNSQFSESISENTGLDENNVKAIIENAILNRWVDVEVRTRAGPLIKINKDGNDKLNRLTDKEESLPTGNTIIQNITAETVNFGNDSKVNSDNSFYSNLSNYQRKMFILGIITIFVIIGIATVQMYQSAMDDWDGVIPTKPDEVINTDISGDGNVVIVGDGNTVNSITEQKQQEFASLDSDSMEFLQKLVDKNILQQEQRIKELEEKLSQTTDENERLRLELVIDRLQLATNAMQLEDFPSAENYYHLVLESDKNNLDALEGLGLSLGRQDKFEDSIFYYDEVLKIEEDNYEALINNAWSYAMLKEYEKSITKLNDLEDINSEDMLVLSHKCWVLHKLDFFENAVEYCKKVLSEGTEDERIPRAYSFSLSMLGMAEEALPFYEKLYEIHPDEFSIIMNYGNTLSDVGQNQEALIIYNKGLEIFENNNSLLHNKNALCINNPELNCKGLD